MVTNSDNVMVINEICIENDVTKILDKFATNNSDRKELCWGGRGVNGIIPHLIIYYILGDI